MVVGSNHFIASVYVCTLCIGKQAFDVWSDLVIHDNPMRWLSRSAPNGFTRSAIRPSHAHHTEVQEQQKKTPHDKVDKFQTFLHGHHIPWEWIKEKRKRNRSSIKTTFSLYARFWPCTQFNTHNTLVQYTSLTHRFIYTRTYVVECIRHIARHCFRYICRISVPCKAEIEKRKNVIHTTHIMNLLDIYLYTRSLYDAIEARHAEVHFTDA